MNFDMEILLLLNNELIYQTILYYLDYIFLDLNNKYPNLMLPF